MNYEEPLKQTEKKSGWIREIINFVLIAVFVVLPFRLFIAQPFIVSGESMVPTFQNGEYLIVDQISYRFETPKRDSVLIFKYPKDPSKYYIKRIIGLPGETVEIRKGIVFIKNKDNPDGFKLEEPFVKEKDSINFTSGVLGPEDYFVLGDNRSHSSDSRFWGTVNKKYIIGRPILRLFPLNTLSIFPGNKSYDNQVEI